MLLDLRSLIEVAEGEHVGIGASTGAPATSVATSIVIPVLPPALPVFIGGTGPWRRPEPLVFVGEVHSVGAPATSHAMGTVRPSPVFQNMIALGLLGFGPEEMAPALGLTRLPPEAAALAE